MRAPPILMMLASVCAAQKISTSELIRMAAGNWPVANIAMANALKSKGYDYHFSFGVGEHNDGHGAAELPEAMTWLWRDYDPARTSQDFLQDPAEKDQPVWRVVQINRR